jgi:hypothetical protein
MSLTKSMAAPPLGVGKFMGYPLIWVIIPIGYKQRKFRRLLPAMP